MTENFIPSEVNQALNGQTVKLSMSGCSAHEENLITSLALGKRPVKQVLWGGLDYASMKGDIDRVRDETTPFLTTSMMTNGTMTILTFQHEHHQRLPPHHPE